MPTGPTFAELWPTYATWGASNLDSWHKVNRCHGEHLLAHFGPLPWPACDYSAADAYVIKRRGEKVRRPGADSYVHPRSIDHELSSAKAFLNWCVRRQLIARNPMDRYRMRLTRDEIARIELNSRKFHVTEEDFLRLVECAMPNLCRLMIAFAFETGMRRDEFRMLTNDEIDLEAKVIRLPAHRTKSRKARAVPLSDLAIQILAQANRLREIIGAPARFAFQNPHASHASAVSRSTLDKWFSSAREKAGIKGPKNQAVWLHSLRKSWATIAATETTIPVQIRMDVLGHTDPGVHQEYLEATDAHASIARDALNERRRDPKTAASTARLMRTLGIV